MALDPLFLNLTATALVLLAAGFALARERARRWPPAAPLFLAFLVAGALALMRAGVALEDWTLVFAAAFAFGWYAGAPPSAWTARAALVGAGLGLAGAALALLLSATHQWWYGPLALLLALAVGVARHAVAALRAWRRGDEGGAPANTDGPQAEADASQAEAEEPPPAEARAP